MIEEQVHKLLLGISRTGPDCEYYTGRVSRVVRDVKGSIPSLIDTFSSGQMQSKRWLVNKVLESFDDIGVVFHCAGWTGIVSNMLLRSDIKINKIRLFDIDSNACIIADRINSEFMIDGWKFKSVCTDIHDVGMTGYSYVAISNKGEMIEQCDSADTVINTSCEHINNFSEWYKKIPAGTKVILQSNNFYSISDHINCHETLDAFEEQTPMSSVMFNGTLSLDGYDRFMRIGVR